MNGHSLKHLVESEGVEGAALKLQEAISDPEHKLDYDKVSFKEIWETFVGPCSETLPRGGRFSDFSEQPLVEANISRSFSIVTGNIINRKVQESYKLAPKILDVLVTSFTSTMRTERSAGFQAFSDLEDVPEGQEYPETGFFDRGVETPEPPKRGEAVFITHETLIFDQTGQILRRAGAIGQHIAVDREVRGLKWIQDLSGFKAFYPLVDGVPTQTDVFRTSGAGSAWYNKTTNLKASNALVDWTDIEAAWLLFAAMVDEAGQKITVDPKILLVPYALAATARYIMNSTNQVGDHADGVKTTIHTGNIAVGVVGNLKIVTTPHLNDATTWFLGDFKAQYQERVIIPVSVVSLPPNPMRDIVAGFRGRYKARIECIDDKFVVESNS